MEDLPQPPKVDTPALVRVLDERFRSVGVTSPDGRLSVNLAMLYQHASSYMETIRMATQEMADEDGLIDVLVSLKSYLSSMTTYMDELKPEIHDIFEEH